MSIIEAGVRGAAIALMLLLAALLLRDGRKAPAARWTALFVLGSAANLVRTAAPLEAARALWLLPLRVLANGNPAVLWLLAAALFDDGFTPSWPYAAAWIGLVGLNLVGLYGGGAFAYPAANGLALICIGLSLWRALDGRAGDLVEPRRRLRLVFLVSVGLYTGATIVSAVLLRGGPGYSAFTLADAGGNLALAFVFGLALLSLTPGLILAPAMAAPSARREPAADDPRDAALLAALRHEVEHNRAYRQEALSIAALAARLGVPEYRLRRLINQRLGHRNFSAFLNGYRLADAEAALADAAQAEVPIVTIALDAGFNSLGPFNRAFRARTGMTPTAYRRAKGS
jgi:AraC-like DNA-binding protein